MEGARASCIVLTTAFDMPKARSPSRPREVELLKIKACNKPQREKRLENSEMREGIEQTLRPWVCQSTPSYPIGELPFFREKKSRQYVKSLEAKSTSALPK